MAHVERRTCLRAVVEMCADLHQHSTASRYIKHMGGPLYELKKRASDGGDRVSFFCSGQSFVLVHAECKNENQAAQNPLLDALAVPQALGGQQPVVDTQRR